MNLLRNILFSIVIVVVSMHGSAQNTNKSDLLLSLLKNENNDSVKIDLLLQMAEYYQAIDIDSALMYYQQALDIVNKELSDNEHSYITQKLEILKKTGNIYFNVSLFGLAEINYKAALELSILNNNKEEQVKMLINIGLVKKYTGEYDIAMQYMMDALKIAESIYFEEGMGLCYSILGVIHLNQKRFSKSAYFLLKAAEIFDKNNNTPRLVEIYNNLGALHAQAGDHEKALQYYVLAKEKNEELGDIKGIALALLNMGISSNSIAQYKNAVYYCEAAIQLSKETGDKKGLSEAYNCLASVNLNRANMVELKGDSLAKIKYLDSSVFWAHKAFKISEDIGSLPIKNKTAINLKQAYYELGDYKTSTHYADVVINTNDSMFVIANVSALLEMTARYETEKKQLQIERMERQQELDKFLITRQRTIILFVIIVLLISVVFMLFFYKLLRDKRLAHEALLEKNEEINQQKEEILAQRDELEEHRDKLIKHREEIDSSIRYAKQIQNALLPSGQIINENFSESFIVYKPKDIVSGDFYWVREINNKIIVAVVDCTGHGVPGALMSMLGISFLTEIVVKEKETNAANILNKLRVSVIDAFKQDKKPGTQKEGMDMSIMVINKSNYECEMAGANLSLFLLRKNVADSVDTITSDNIEEIKGDKMPVSVHLKMKDFLNNKVQLSKGDIIYMFTDGFYHQFGGMKGKSYMYKPFKSFVAKVASHEFKKQGKSFENELKHWMTWKGHTYEQIDDITVIGLRL